MEIPHFVFITPGNSTSYLVDPLEFPYALSSVPPDILCPQHPAHSPLPLPLFDVWYFSGIAHYGKAALEMS